MAKKNKVKIQKVDPVEKNKVFEIFTLIFPSLIIAGIATTYSTLSLAIVSIALFVYQSALLKRYIESKTV